jgi:hypothetical protein
LAAASDTHLLPNLAAHRLVRVLWSVLLLFGLGLAEEPEENLLLRLPLGEWHLECGSL